MVITLSNGKKNITFEGKLSFTTKIHNFNKVRTLAGAGYTFNNGVYKLINVNITFINKSDILLLEHILLNGILDIETNYLIGEELKYGENERYDLFKKSDIKEPIYNHCIKAIKKACNFGENGLPKIGSGDWNDGFSNVGTNPLLPNSATANVKSIRLNSVTRIELSC